MFIPQFAALNEPHAVGCVDVEIDAPGSETGRDPALLKADALEASSIFTRIYYPTAKESIQSHSRAYWLPRGLFYVNGYGNFANIPWLVTSLFSAPIVSWITMPCYMNPPLLQSHDTLPVIVFCHGLAGMRTTYSNLCIRLAAQGFIVVAIEHCDGSAAVTSRHGTRHTLHHDAPDPKRALPGESEHQYYKRFRSRQIEIRVQDVLNSIDLIGKLNRGDISLEKNYYSVPQSTLDSFKDKFDLKNMALIGHSFGGATAMKVLSLPDHPFVCGVSLDPWMYPLVNLENLIIKTPYLTIQSEIFHWADNAKELVSVFRSPSTHAQSRFGFFANTGHNDCSDLPILFPSLMKQFGQSGSLHYSLANEILDQWLHEYLATFLTLPFNLKRYEAFAVGDQADYVPSNLREHVLIGKPAMKRLLDHVKLAQEIVIEE